MLTTTETLLKELAPNAIYQIKNRIKERLQEEVRKIQEFLPDGR